MTANLSASADPKIKEIITSLDDDKIGKVTYLPVMHCNKNNILIFFPSYSFIGSFFDRN